MLKPGVTYLLRRLRACLPLPTALYVARYLAITRFGIDVPLWLFIFAVLVSFPLYFVVSIVVERLNQRREAAAMGAVFAPEWKGERIGNLDVLDAIVQKANRGYPIEAFMEPHKRLGPALTVRILWDTIIATTQPEHVKAVLATEFNSFEKGRRFFHQAKSVLGTGVFNSDGDMWKFHRSMTRPFFSRDRISHFDIFDRHTDHVISAMKKRLRERRPLDFQDLMFRFTLDSAAEFLFGAKVNSLADELPQAQGSNQYQVQSQSAADQFAQAFGEAQEVVSERGRLGRTWALREFFLDKTEKSMKVVNEYLNEILEDALKRNENEKRVGGAKKSREDIEDDETLLDHLIKTTHDKTILKDEILNIMIAGRDTTAATLSFAIYLMSMHPEVFNKLRAEVLSTVGKDRRPTYDDIKTMKYLRAVINETLRLFPVVPRNGRRSTKATTLPPVTPGGKPIYVPKGTAVVYSVFLMHRRTDLWGPDAHEFSPERFLDERLHKYLTPNPFIFLPFNAGPRICLGQQFAYNESSFMLIRLLQQFDRVDMVEGVERPAVSMPPIEWSLGAGEKPDQRMKVERIWPKSHLTMSIHGGLWVNFREAKSEGEVA